MYSKTLYSTFTLQCFARGAPTCPFHRRCFQVSPKMRETNWRRFKFRKMEKGTSDFFFHAVENSSRPIQATVDFRRNLIESCCNNNTTIVRICEISLSLARYILELENVATRQIFRKLHAGETERAGEKCQEFGSSTPRWTGSSETNAAARTRVLRAGVEWP